MYHNSMSDTTDSLPLPLASIHFDISSEFTVDELAKPFYDAAQVIAKIAGSALTRGILTPADAPMATMLQASANLLAASAAIQQAMLQAQQRNRSGLLVPEYQNARPAGKLN